MTIAFIVVILDIAIGFLFYFGLQHMKVMQLLTNQDINESIVMAQDFSVLLVGLPSHASVRSLKTEMWNWIETVNEKEPERAVTLEGEPDLNQDSLMSINYGLNDYGRL